MIVEIWNEQDQQFETVPMHKRRLINLECAELVETWPDGLPDVSYHTKKKR